MKHHFVAAVTVLMSIFLLQLMQNASWAASGTMTFTSKSVLHNNSVLGGFIVAEGIITKNTPADFERFYEKNSLGQILLNSPGGSLTAGLLLGQKIRELGLSTYVGNWFPEGDFHGNPVNAASCFSACAYAFLGGGIRRVSSGAIGLSSVLPLLQPARNSKRACGVGRSH